MTMLNMNLYKVIQIAFFSMLQIDWNSLQKTDNRIGIPERSLEAIIGIVWDDCQEPLKYLEDHARTGVSG